MPPLPSATVWTALELLSLHKYVIEIRISVFALMVDRRFKEISHEKRNKKKKTFMWVDSKLGSSLI